MSKTITGAAIVTPQVIQLTEAKVNITPAQDLHGYDRPWAAGAGKNLLKYPYNQSTLTNDGITFTVTAEGIVLNGTCTSNTVSRIYLADEADGDFILNNGQKYILTGSPGVHGISLYYYGDTRIEDDGNGAVFSYYSSDDAVIAIDVSRGTTCNNILVKPMITTLGNRGASYEPYANVCPITGRTTLTLNDGKKSGGQDATYTASLGRTVYGGTYDFVTGDGTTSWANIASYNGETLPGKWLSSLDKYTEDGTPTTGAQVVYDTGTATTFTRSGQTINTLKGVNYFWSDAGVVTVTGDFAYLMREFYNYIYINGVQYIRPTSFQIQREDIYAGEYETCTGKIIGDRVGWRYANMTIHFDTLPNEKLQQLSVINEAVELYFIDDDGEHSEQIIRTGFTNTPTRLTHPDGSVIWQDVNMQVRFINAHND